MAATGKRIAVIGGGISGLSAAWLLARRHSVTLFEAEPRLGGHSNTIEAACGAGSVPVDTGFIVYNTASYPNLIALFDHLKVPTAASSMSFAVSLAHGAYEYSGSGVAGLIGQAANLVRPGHWRMLADIPRFFRAATALAGSGGDETLSLGDFLQAGGYSRGFVDHHILPMTAAIWSTPSAAVLDFPAAAFARFFANHGLLQVNHRPQWRTVVGGSREYVRRLRTGFPGEVVLGSAVRRVTRGRLGVTVATDRAEGRFDTCVLACHADDALSLLADADGEERHLLGAFRYSLNRAVLHGDAGWMPKRRRLWSSWNYISPDLGRHKELSVTYWMNSLQPLGASTPDLFVTLNPARDIAAGRIFGEWAYAHPMFDAAALRAQRQLWRIQARRATWFCGSYFGFGFHEDGLQSGLAVAEGIGGVHRPWSVADESGRIHLGPKRQPAAILQEAAE
jgi:predicted NAD/FAD-binding protein